jgi:lysozyme
MKPRHQVSRAAIELIKRFEGYRRKAAQLPDGRWTIGYGHTLTAREGAEVSEEDAEALLLYDLITVAHVVNEQVFAPLTQNQFDALCAFAFNVGLDNFRRSAVVKRVNEGAFIQAAFALELWRKVDFEGERIVLDALVRRRAAEKFLFLTPAADAFVPAPSPLLKPVLDVDALDTAPRQAATTLVPSLEGEQVVAHVAGPAEGPRLEEPTPEPDPIRAAAEEITARLQTIFPEAGEPAPNVEERPSDAGPAAAEPEILAPEPVEEPISPEAEPLMEPAKATPPVGTLADQPPADLTAEVAAEEPEAEPPPANDLADPASEAEPHERVVIDDTAPFEFTPAPVQPLERPKDGLFSLVFLAVIGLAFFSGGVFWALNAQPGPTPAPLTPVAVGWLAGVAGVGFFAVAVYLLLHKLGQASERRGRDNPRI